MTDTEQWLRAEVAHLKVWAEAECAARRCYMEILYNIFQAADNAGLEIATPKSVFEKANSLQEVADAARKAVEYSEFPEVRS